ncbi:DUF4351 domain-containing protein [Massilia horti]|uniref:Transposase n=1 Tax=Massilia horti TaxID=2562153 RepID=A0A4Y9T1K8_9BURK|nr:DUF4351 domain-containing protein [Massilia horti]TFW30793.1 transposase [Massilia horti]
MTTPDDYDTPWKDALTRYFPEFMAFYFPKAYRQIDWSRPHAFLEQELAQVVRDGQSGRRRVDKLVRVFRSGGGEEWVFVHIDVQGNYDRHFAERIFQYNYRIYDRYRRPVASLVLLADESPKWKPTAYEYALFGCEVGIRFPSVKLNGYAGRINELLEEKNAFAVVTAAHLLTQQTRGRDVERHAEKWRLARMLFERKWDRQRVLDLFNVIDWMMEIAPPLQAQLMQDISTLERERNMPYISSFERKGREEGRLEGKKEMLRGLLKHRFGELPQSAEKRLANASQDELTAWSEAVLVATTLERVFEPD